MSTTPDSALNHPITETDIANYLANTPEFFARHAELLAAVQLTSPHSHRAVSLQERQAEMLRDKIRMLEQRIMEMIRNGGENVLLSDKVVLLASKLLQVQEAAAMAPRLLQEIETLFAVPQVGLRVWDVAPEYAQRPFAQAVSDDVKSFATSLSEPFCGLNSGFEAVGWMPDPAAIASLALIPLRATGAGDAGDREAPVFGMLVLASGDAQRFSSGMGTEFLSRIGDLASVALARLR